MTGPDDEAGGISIEVAESVDDALVDAINRLLPQLSSSAPPLSRAELAAVVSSPTCDLFLARDRAGEIVGSLTLAVFPVPTGLRAWIEDVVVNGAARGAGVGAALVNAAVAAALEGGARTVELTSRPSRQDANRLYQRLGFARRETNVYRYSSE